jgi:hypothetical protein
VSEATIGILVDYESPLASRVAGEVWSGLSRTALEAGFTKTTALWQSLREARRETSSTTAPEGPSAHIFVLGQDRPEAIDAIGAIDAAALHLYGVIVAVPDKPSPLAGSLLYQGVGRLTQSGVKAGMVEPALLHAVPTECERYARHLFQRLSKVLWQHSS